MSNQNKIKELIKTLPNRDIPIGERLLKERDFDSLKELVDSAIYRINKNLSSDNPKQEYLDVDMEQLTLLKSEVDAYILILDLPPLDDYEDEDLGGEY